MTTISEWFEVIRDGTVIGTATDQQFARYSEKSGRVHICRAIDGQYLVLNDQFYRDDWMLPLSPESPVEFENAVVVPITETEYDILNTGLTAPAAEPVNQEAPTEAETEKVFKETDIVTVEFVRASKTKELSEACRIAIEGGFSLVLSDGAPHHFSMTREDQLNLIDLQQSLDREDDLMYHADGELMQFYSPEDATDILTAARRWKNYHLARFNSLKNWIGSMTDIRMIDAVTYETSVPEEYCTTAFLSVSEGFF